MADSPSRSAKKLRWLPGTPEEAALLRKAAQCIVQQQRCGMTWLQAEVGIGQRDLRNVLGRLEEVGLIGSVRTKNERREIHCPTLEALAEKYPQLVQEESEVGAAQKPQAELMARAKAALEPAAVSVPPAGMSLRELELLHEELVSLTQLLRERFGNGPAAQTVEQAAQTVAAFAEVLGKIRELLPKVNA